MKWLVFLAGVGLFAADPSRIIYSKSFPGSMPPYVSISVDESGAAEYRESPADDNPLKFKLKPVEAGEIFALAAKLDNFTRPLESPAKVANMGMKTFRVEGGAGTHEVKFNYTQDADARALTDWFERISETEQRFITLERGAKYDKLGVNKALLELEVLWDRKRLVASDQFLPLLDRVSQNQALLHMARSRAAGIADSIRASK